MHKANGKLLLTSEYYVLDGALALAVPSRFGQQMMVDTIVDEEVLLWNSYADDGSCWFSAVFSLPDLLCLKNSDDDTAKTLHSLLQVLFKNNPEKIPDKGGLVFKTYLDFPREWGLGTSSTLIYLLAKWANYNPYQLLFQTMGGSGYDIACAEAEKAVLYSLENYQHPNIESVEFNPPFLEQVYFVYLGKKQNSRNGITHYRKMVADKQKELQRLTEITKEIVACSELQDFCRLITEHEAIIGRKLKLPIVQERYFSDFEGAIKSLGAWGGDFILAASEAPTEKVRGYFNKKGLEVFFGYKEMVKRT